MQGWQALIALAAMLVFAVWTSRSREQFWVQDFSVEYEMPDLKGCGHYRKYQADTGVYGHRWLTVGYFGLAALAE